MNEETSSRFKSEVQEILSNVSKASLSVEEKKKKVAEIASLLMEEALKEETFWEKYEHAQIARLMHDPAGKAFTTEMTDQCFRSSSNKRTAEQLDYLIQKYGIPNYLGFFSRAQLLFFRLLTPNVSQYLIPLVTLVLRYKTAKVILPGEITPLLKHIESRKEEKVRINLNHLGEAILGEKEAKKRLGIYLEDLENLEINYVSIKISTIFSQINLLSLEDTIERIAERLRELYRAALKNTYKDAKGNEKPKFINLDMEEYKDLHITVAVFKKVLSEPEFQQLSAGIALQAYLPDSHNAQVEITEWAQKRIDEGGAPVKIRLVKGANLANEQVEASLQTWPQSPYQSKLDTDSNYKKMVTYALTKQRAKAVNIGIGSHNIFDISYALILRAEEGIEKEVTFEMLEGMADHIRRSLQEITQDILLYCPVALKQDFRFAIAYLIRRLDENTGPENFLKHLFSLKPDSAVWEEQLDGFSKSCDEMNTIYNTPRKTQDRSKPIETIDPTLPFENESNTDFSLPQNQTWVQNIVQEWKEKKIDSIPLVIGGQEIQDNEKGQGEDPSYPGSFFYKYCMAEKKHVDQALETAKNAFEAWAKKPLEEKNAIFIEVSKKIREKRADLLGAMMRDAGKTFPESDPEVSEAVDFVEYYRRQIQKMYSAPDLEWSAKGPFLVTPPWNFPCAIPIGGICAALIAGNPVIFKPAPETVLVGWMLVNIFWEAGIPKDVLQFINCEDEPLGSELIRDSRIAAVILTGATQTALKFLEMRPSLDLSAETGGKNAMVISALSDRDLATQDLILSAFGHSGQKCSACSLAILEAEVYDDPSFMHQLKDAAESLFVGPADDLRTKVGPLIRSPSDALSKGLVMLEEGEEWLLEPKKVSDSPNLYSPGIKKGVKVHSFTQKTELFGPVLGLIRAESFEEAVQIANSTEYGLTSGLHSLDDREHDYWMEHIQAGNLYINRTTTGAIVRRQPFGGCKKSSFGNQLKAGGPNYLYEMMHCKQASLPKHKLPINEAVNSLVVHLDKIDLDAQQLGVWTASLANYAYWNKRMHLIRDPSKLVGQDNLFKYVPRKNVNFRIEPGTSIFDALRAIAACLSCNAPMILSFDSEKTNQTGFDWKELGNHLVYRDETDEHLLHRIETGQIQRLRYLNPPPENLYNAAAKSGCYLATQPVLANGRYELLQYLREVSISRNYHRYGNLGIREGELRKPIL